MRKLPEGTRKELTAMSDVYKLEARKGRAVCPICGRETQTRIVSGTILDRFPLYCKNCRRTTLVQYREPEPLSLSR